MQRRTLITSGLATVAALALPVRPQASDLTTHAHAIADLMRASAPDGAYLKGFSFRCRDGELDPNSIWATVHLSNGNLSDARPAVFNGWRERSLSLVGGLV